MNKLGVLSTNVKTYFMRRLIEEVGKDLLILSPGDLKPLDVNHLLVRTSGVGRNDRDLKYLESLPGTLMIHNPIKTLALFRSKNSQYDFFNTHSLPHLPWIDLSGGIYPHEAAELLNHPASYLVKPRYGQGGWGIERLDKSELRNWWERQKGKGDLDFILQPFIQNAAEYRIFFCSDYRLSLKREAASGVAANFAAEGMAIKRDLPSEFQPLIENLISLSGAEYGAIDLFVIGDQMQILELNTVPGIEQAEALCGTNLMGLILNKIIN